MKYILAAGAALMALACAYAAEARDWSHSGTVTTPRGTYTSQGAGSCANGMCERSGSTTGPNGKSVSSSGSITRTDNGYTYAREVTGPNGGTVSKSGSVTVTRP